MVCIVHVSGLLTLLSTTVTFSLWAVYAYIHAVRKKR